MIIGVFYQNNKKGGLDTFLINLINNFPDKTAEFLIFCNKSHPGGEKLKLKLKNSKIVFYDFITYDDLKQKYSYNRIFELGAKLLFGIFGNVYQIVKINKIFKKNFTDKLIVVSGGYPGGDANVSALIAWGIKYKKNLAIYNFHNSAKPYSGNIVFKLRELLFDFLINKYSKNLISVSQNCIESLNNRKFIKDRKKKFIYNGIDQQRFISLEDKTNFREKNKINKKDKIILMLGVYEERKGHQFLIEVYNEILKQNKETVLIMAGDGENEYKDQIHKEILKKGLEKKIVLLNHVDDITKLMKESSLVVVPSVAFESFGYTALEAMFHRLPVICSNVGGLPEVVKNNISGFVLTHKKEIFVEKILSVLNDDNLAKKMGNSGYAIYKEKFTSAIMASHYSREINK